MPRKLGPPPSWRERGVAGRPASESTDAAKYPSGTCGNEVSPDGQPPSVRCPSGRPRPRSSPARRGQRRPAPTGGGSAKTGAARGARPPASPDPTPAEQGARAESPMITSRRKARQSRSPGAQVLPPTDAPRLEFLAAPAGPGRAAFLPTGGGGKNRL